MCTRKRSFDGTVSKSHFHGQIDHKNVPFTHTGKQDTIFPTMTKKNGTLQTKSRFIGYARVSKGEQNLNLQTDALEEAGCTKDLVFVDKISGAKAKRPGLDACLKELRQGDVLIVWRLDRLGRSMAHLVAMIEELKEKGIGFRSISDGVVDTTSPSGELVFNLFSALAQFERRLIQERTKAGLDAARARGRKGGRKPIAPDDPRILMAKTMHNDKGMKISDICKTLKISRTTFYRYLNKAA